MLVRADEQIRDHNHPQHVHTDLCGAPERKRQPTEFWRPFVELAERRARQREKRGSPKSNVTSISEAQRKNEAGD